MSEASGRENDILSFVVGCSIPTRNGKEPKNQMDACEAAWGRMFILGISCVSGVRRAGTPGGAWTEEMTAGVRSPRQDTIDTELPFAILGLVFKFRFIEEV